MGDLTKNFSRAEFACRCGCGFDDVDLRLVEGLQIIRDHFGKPVTVNCGCRCKAHNKEVGSTSKQSQHTLGKAADIRIEGVTPVAIARFASTIERFNKGGIGVYETFVHLDIRGKTARWGKAWRS